MQTRVTKQAAAQDDKKHYQVTWLLEVWPNLVPLTDPTIISETITHEFQEYDPEDPNSEQDYIKQQERIDAYLKNKAVEYIEKYLSERNIIESETRIDVAATDLKTIIDETYTETEAGK